MAIKVGMMQVNTEFSGQWYFPYAAGLLESFGKRHLSDPQSYEFLTPVFRRESIANIVERFKRADIVGATLYSWNEQFTMKSLQTLKHKRPSILIICGGPQVPRADRPWEVEAFHRKYPFVDILVHGAGEGPFLEILKAGLNGARETIPSVSFRNSSDMIIQTKPGKDFDDLSEVPDPYLTGVFDPLNDEYGKVVRWIAGLETNRKCPFACTFCSWPMGKPVLRPLPEVFRTLDNAVVRYRSNYVFIFDANFGIFRERDLAIAEHLVKLKKEHGLPNNVNVQDGKNIEEWVYRIRKTMFAGGIDSPAIIALQSIHPPTLKAIKRHNIKTKSYRINQHRFAAENIPTMTDLILALPEETLESFKFGVGEIISWGQHDRFHFNNLSMTPDAEVTHRDQRKQHGIETVWIKMENMHGVIEPEDEAPEYEELAIATRTLPREEWIQARVFSWATNFYHMNKVIQIPNVICHIVGSAGEDDFSTFWRGYGIDPRSFPLSLQLTGIRPRYDKLIDLFLSPELDPLRFPLLIQIRDYFTRCAERIQAGLGQYSPSKEWLGINWPADEYVLIKLVREDTLHQFYAEAEQLLFENVVIDRKLLHQAFVLGNAFLKLPFREDEHVVECDWNIFEVYRGVRVGKFVGIIPGHYRYCINWSYRHPNGDIDSWQTWQDWYRKVVWWCNRSGNYFHNPHAITVSPVPAGHH